MITIKNKKTGEIKQIQETDLGNYGLGSTTSPSVNTLMPSSPSSQPSGEFPKITSDQLYRMAVDPNIKAGTYNKIEKIYQLQQAEAEKMEKKQKELAEVDTTGGADAAKIGLAKTGIKAVDDAKKALFGKADITEDDVKKTSGKGKLGLLGATTDFSIKNLWDATPFGRALQQDLFDAVEALLRIRSGAAVPESEVRRYLNEKGPRLTDPAKVKFSKIQSIQDELNTILSEMGKSGDKYVVEEIQ